MPGALSVLQVLLRRRQFRALFFGLSISRLGDTFSAVAIAWLVLELAGPRELGLLFVVGAISRACSAPFMGHLLDRFGARRVLIVDNLVRAALVAVLPFLAWAGMLELVHVFVISFLTGILSTATEIGQDLVVPLLVEDDELEPANAATSTTFDLAEWIGPALGGLTIQVAGIEPALLVNACTFLVMTTTVLALPKHGGGRSAGATVSWRERLYEVSKGFILLWRMRTVLVLTIAGMGVLIVDGALQVFWPTYSRETLEVGAASYGLLVSVAGLGSLLGTLVLTPYFARLGSRWAIVLSLGLAAVFLAPISLVDSLPAALVLAALFGLCAAPFYPISRSMVQRSTSEAERGRVFGARAAITACAFPAGGAAAGFGLSLADPAYVVLAIALVHIPLAIIVLVSVRSGRAAAVDRAAHL